MVAEGTTDHPNPLHIHAYHHTLSSLSSLPPEIINEIIIRRWESSCPPSRVHKPDPDDPALPRPELSVLHALPAVAMSQICRRWRAIAFSNGLIWSTIFACDDSPRWDQKRYKAYLSAYLHRSSKYPLSIRVQGEISYRFEKHLLPLLLQQAPRWKHLDCPPGFLTLGSFRSSSFPILYTLYVDSGPHNATDNIHPAFPHTPSLRRVVVHNREVASLLSLPWEQLTSFTGAINNWLTDRDSIVLLTKVVDLNLEFFHLSAPVVLPEVRNVHLTFKCVGESMCDILSTINFPKMESLTIRGGWFNRLPSYLFHSFSTFLHRTKSPKALTTLSLSDFPLTTFELMETFHIVPELTYLKIRNATVELFQHLTVLPSSTVDTIPLPRLKHLDVGGCFNKVDVDALLDLVKSRRKLTDAEGNVLDTLDTLTVPNHVWKDFIEDEKLQFEGLNHLGLRFCVVSV